MSTNSKVLSFKVDSFRKIPNPYLRSDNPSESLPQMYEMICDVLDIPDDIPMDTNPRKQSLKTDVAREITGSLISPAEQRNFYLLNRGLLVSAESVSFNSETSMVTIVFSDTGKHGDIDGGHTYEIIKKARNEGKIPSQGFQFVKIEALTGVDDMFEQLAKARNYSVKVQDKSMAELEQKFGLIKEALQGQPYFSDIEYVENDNGRIDILDLLTLFNMFNLSRYSNGQMDSFPINSYSSKASCLKTYIDDYDHCEKNGSPEDNPYIKMKGIMPDIVRLYDHLEKNIARYYKGDSSGIKKYGSITGVSVVKDGKPRFQSRFFASDMDYLTPNGFLYPIIGAFRAIVEEYNGQYRWKRDPFEAMDSLGSVLVQSTVQMSRDLGNNPNATGKSVGLWQNLYMRILVGK